MVDMNMIKEKMQQMQQGEGEAPSSGKISDLFSQLHSLMGQISEKINSAPPEIISEEDKQEWGQLTTGVDGFVTQNLSQAPGQKISSFPEAKPLAGSVPMESGVHPGAQPMPNQG